MFRPVFRGGQGGPLPLLVEFGGGKFS